MPKLCESKVSMISNIKQSLKDLSDGKLIVVLDDFDRENEGDIIGIASKINSDDINFMITHGKGLLCAPISLEIAKRNGFNLMNQVGSDGTNFLESIDANNSTTGISSFERMDTFNQLTKGFIPFKKPGHLFPLLAVSGGLSKRRGHTEAAVDLAKLIGEPEVGAIIEIVGNNGEMLRRDGLIDFSKKHGLTMITIEDLVEYIKVNKKEIWEIDKESKYILSNTAAIPTKNGNILMTIAKNTITGQETILKHYGPLEKQTNVRIHSECKTSEIFGSLKCDCKLQLDNFTNIMLKEKNGLLIYTLDEGRGNGIFNKINSYKLQEKGFDTIDADLEQGLNVDNRNYAEIGNLIKFLPISNEIYLYTNNPDKIKLFTDAKIITKRKEFWFYDNDKSIEYLKTKKNKMKHLS